MFVTLIKKYGIWLTTAGISLLGVMLSVVITSSLLMVFQGYVDWVGIVVCILAPALILPLPLYLFLRLFLKLDAGETEILEKNRKLEEALEQVRQLSGLLPICASCKKIRDDSGYWNEVEGYLKEHSDVEFTHSICPDCVRTLYAELEDEND